MPVYFGNKSHNIIFGTSPIEKMGGDKLTYSMYGDNIPVKQSSTDLVKWKQPTIVRDAQGFTSNVSSVSGFSVYADSAYDGRGVGYAFDTDIIPNGQSTYEGTNVWHSGGGYPHYIGFKTNDILQVNKLTIYNGCSNCIPKDYKVECIIDGSYTTVVSGTNTNINPFSSWDIVIDKKYNSNNWKITFISGSGIDGGTYVSIAEIRIDALMSAAPEEPSTPVIPENMKLWVRPTLTADDRGTSQTKSKYAVGGDYFAVEMDSAWNDGDRSVYKAFDGIIDLYNPEVQNSTNDTDWMSCALMGIGSYHWIKFYNPEPVMITKFRWYYNDSATDICRIEKCEFQCSDNNVDWITLKDFDFTDSLDWTAMNDYVEGTITNSGLHKYYRVYVTKMKGNGYSYSNGVLPCRELYLEGYIADNTNEDESDTGIRRP